MKKMTFQLIFESMVKSSIDIVVHKKFKPVIKTLRKIVAELREVLFKSKAS